MNGKNNRKVGLRSITIIDNGESELEKAVEIFERVIERASKPT